VADVAVCVASHHRPARLRRLLEALSEQTLPRERFEVIVCHTDGPGSEADVLLDTHELAQAGVLKNVHAEARFTGAAEKRNRAWKAASAPLIVFTDDDVRPPPEWLERMVEACERNPGAVVQGAVRPDPDEVGLLHAAPHSRTLIIDPPHPYGECANIAYPRALLERLGGFDEREPPLEGGEDTDLAQRAIRAGAPYVGAPEAVTWHAVTTGGLLARLRSIPRWTTLAYVAAEHPHMRRHMFLRLFWRPSHAALLPALYGLARRRPLLVLPWAVMTAPRYGASPRGIARSLSELPSRLAIEVVELVTAIRGAIRYRTPFL